MPPLRSGPHAAFREALGTDVSFYARFVDIWRHPRNVGEGASPLAQGVERTPVTINDIAWETGVSQAKAAITMRYMAKQGLARRVGPRTEQHAYEPTEKALEMFPDSDVQVMPDATVTSIAPGVTVQSMTEAEARALTGEDPSLRRVGRRPPKGMPQAKEPFKGYLTEGDDPAA